MKHFATLLCESTIPNKRLPNFAFRIRTKHFRSSPCNQCFRMCPPLCRGRHHQPPGILRQHHLLHHSSQHEPVCWRRFLHERVPPTQAHFQGETGRGPVWRSIFSFAAPMLALIWCFRDILDSSACCLSSRVMLIYLYSSQFEN